MLTKKTKTISINIISALIILICLCLGVVSGTNAWFTSERKNGVEIIVDVGVLQLKVYQNEVDANKNNEINSEKTNETAVEKKYIQLDGQISSDVPVNLKLILTNEDRGSAAMFIRYKFELFARGVEEDILIPTTIDGYGAVNATAKGFRQNLEDGFYYYQKAGSTGEFSTNNNALFENGQNSQIVLLTSFTVPYEDYCNFNGSETVYIKLTIQASSNNNFPEYVSQL